MFSMALMAFFLIELFLVGPLYSVNLTITSDLTDMVVSKKIGVRCTLGAGEKGIVANSLQFSVDHTDIFLLAWHQSSHMSDYYSGMFKRNKKIFTDGFCGDLVYNAKYADVILCKQVLLNSSLYFSCFLIREDGSCEPVSKVIAFREGQKASVVNDQASCAAISRQSDYDAPIAIQKIASPCMQNFERDFDAIEKLGKTVEEICKICSDFFFNKTFYWWYVASIIFFLFCVANLHCSRLHWIFGFLQQRVMDYLCASSFIAILGTLYILRVFISHEYIIALYAMLCCIMAVYAYKDYVRGNFFGDRLKKLFGLILGSMVLPLLVMAYLLHCGL